MSTHSWPGNILELENVIERSVLLARGPIIEEVALSLNHQENVSIIPQDIRMKTIRENERDYIITILKKCTARSGVAGVLLKR